MANTNIFAMTDSWNNAGVIFTAIQMNVTDTASDPTSKLLDLQVGGASKFSVRKDGVITAFNVLQTTVGNIVAGNAVAAASGFWNAALTSQLIPSAANLWEQRNGVNPQTFNVYNTFTDASNYERGFARWNANVYEMGTEAAGTGTLRNIRFVFGTNSGGFNLGAASITPIMYVASGTTGKATGLLAGSGGSALIFDVSGGLTIATDTRTNIVGGTSSGGTSIWQFGSTGHFTAGADNTYDIGASGANRPRNLYMGSWIRMATSTVAALPAAATAGVAAKMFVTDATTPAFGATVVGGGAVLTPVYSDGINWKVG